MTVLHLARGDGSDRAQRLGVQLAPHQPPADVHLKGDARGCRRHDTSNRSRAVALPASPERAHLVVELQLKLEFSSICGYPSKAKRRRPDQGHRRL
jgi:hypothetical protein